MHILGIIAGLALIATILVDAFETIVQPRRVTRRVRLTRLFLLVTWSLWSAAARRLPGQVGWESSTPRDRRLGVYGPLALLLLLGLWATSLVVGFALVLWGVGASLNTVGPSHFGNDLYLSGTTFFTLGLGDIVPGSRLGRLTTVAEAATGFSFLALIIGYLPTIYSAFSAREVGILLLDARAGTPPSAVALFQRFGRDADPVDVNEFLREWERWSADLLDSLLSYPVLVFFRSQHERQSWLAALTMILDACSLLLVGIETEAGPLPKRQARLTFAMARHAIGDLSQITNSPPRSRDLDRLPPDELERVRQSLAIVGLTLRAGEAADHELVNLRALYEPYAAAMADQLFLTIPPWIPLTHKIDDWTTTAWQTDPLDALRAVGWAHPRPDEPEKDANQAAE